MKAAGKDSKSINPKNRFVSPAEHAAAGKALRCHGDAAVMASDLAPTPATGPYSARCYLMNFGGFTTPERNVIFAISARAPSKVSQIAPTISG